MPTDIDKLQEHFERLDNQLKDALNHVSDLERKALAIRTEYASRLHSMELEIDRNRRYLVSTKEKKASIKYALYILDPDNDKLLVPT